jgi:hypothetical protein
MIIVMVENTRFLFFYIKTHFQFIFDPKYIKITIKTIINQFIT